MKRGPGHFGDAQAENKRAAASGKFCLKFLEAPEEAQVLLHARAEIQQLTGAELEMSGSRDFYPGTQLQELTIRGYEYEAVLAAKVHCLTKVFSSLGRVNNGEAPLGQGDGRVKVVVPTRAAASIIGSGGAAIKQMRGETGLFVHVEKAPIGEGETVEQVVAMSGALTALQAGLKHVANHALPMMSEPWYSLWAATSNAGRFVPGLVMDFTGKGCSKGKGGFTFGKGAALAPPALLPGYKGAPGGPPGAGAGVVVAPPRSQPVQQGGQLVHCLKLLISPQEATAIIGPGGSTIASLQQQSGARLRMSPRDQFYPGCQLQELNVQASMTEAVLSGALLALTRVIEEFGRLSCGEEHVGQGECRLKVVMPKVVTTSVIGKGGQNIKELRAASSLHVHVEQYSVPLEGGELAEQIVTLSGQLHGVQTALPMLLEHTAARVAEPWFSAWASLSNCGMFIPGLVLEFTGRGQKGGGKGPKGVLPNPVAPPDGAFNLPPDGAFNLPLAIVPASAGGLQEVLGAQDVFSWGPDFSWGQDAGGGALSSTAGGGDIHDKRRTLPFAAGSLVMKVLLSEREGSCIIGQGGRAVEEIQQKSGARLTLSARGLFYPGTRLQELNVAGPTSEAVLIAVARVLTKIVEEMGAVACGEDGVAPGEGRLKIVLPSRAASTLIGKGGAAIRELRVQSGLHVHVEQTRIPPGGGTDVDEQVISLSGRLSGAQVALTTLMEHTQALLFEAWFPSWAGLSNCGFEIPGLQLELSGVASKGKSKGKTCGKGPDGWVDDRSTARFLNKRVAEAGVMAAKILVSAKEASCIIGSGGARVAEIQRSTTTKLTLSGKDEYYPGTSLQEVNIQGPSKEAVTGSVAACLGKILEDLGVITGGAAHVEAGHALLRLVLPSRATEALAGYDGEPLRKLCGTTGVAVQVGQSSVVPLHDMSSAEQVVTVSGPILGVHAVVPKLIGYVSPLTAEPWFAAWAGTSSCMAAGS